MADSMLVRSVVISSMLAADHRRTVQKIIPLIGMQLLGDIGKPFNSGDMGKLLVKLEIGEVIGAEVLARWLHPSKGLIAPSSFIPVLMSCNLMDDLFFNQFDQSLLLQKKALTQGHSINSALNMKSGLLAGSNLHMKIGSRIADYGLDGSGLTFELTEGDALDINPLTLGNLLRLRMLGCRLSIDDFGCGHSSLQRLCDIPFSEIKIDAGFVNTPNSKSHSHAIISNTLALGGTRNVGCD